jgi:hypothetical protein
VGVKICLDILMIVVDDVVVGSNFVYFNSSVFV